MLETVYSFNKPYANRQTNFNPKATISNSPASFPNKLSKTPN